MVLRASETVSEVTRWLGRRAAMVPLSPNGWTLLALLPAGLGLVALSAGEVLVGLIAFSVAGAIDAIDGAVARAKGLESHVGAYLDGMVDRFVEAALLIGLMLLGYPDWILPGWLWLVLVLFFGTGMTSFARAYADHRGIVTDPGTLASMGGVLERAERLLLVYVSMIGYMLDPIWATYTIALGAVLAILTVIQRMYVAFTTATH